MCIALSIAEMGSSAPTSGALYYWTFKYSPPSCRKYLAWLVGYVNTIGYIAAVAAGDYACALTILTTVTLGTDGAYWHLLLATKVLARIQPLYVLLTTGVFFAFIIALPIATPSEYKNTAKYALGHFENVSDYSDGFAFILSFLAPCWTICESSRVSFTSHISHRDIPAVVICLAFNMGTDLVALLSSPIEQPMAAILANSLGTGGTIAFWVFVAILLYTSVMDILIASSRQVFAFSRDGALPLSFLFYNINPYTGTPVNAVCITPTIARFFGGQSFTPGPFSLGRASGPVAFVATTFMILMMVVFLFPASLAPVAESMNDSIVVVGGIVTLATAHYFVSGRFWFTGPVITAADGSGKKRSEEKLSIKSV
ncbi:hypothetical protein EDD85DRAFT_797906 [Armillaria nabsnona]|nr:hypothetical protein EDD85DRAFT_797906 [Armillaria nabsnona]